MLIVAKIVSNNPETIKQLQKIRSDDRSDIRCYGAALLHKTGYRKKEQVDFIINRLKSELKPESSGEYLIGIIGSLAIIENSAKKAIPIITNLAQHEDSKVRGRALRLIKKVNGLNDLINVCKNNLEHENPDVRIDSIEHLGWDMENSRVRKLMYSAFNDEDPDVIIAACFELYSNNEPNNRILPGFINAFEKGLSGSNASNALFTIELMGLEAKSAIPVLLESMGNARSNRISSYVRTLGKIGCNDKLITNKLIELCESDNEEVREHALRELDRYKEYVRDDQL
jgi:HEAT repeat protein